MKTPLSIFNRESEKYDFDEIINFAKSGNDKKLEDFIDKHIIPFIPFEKAEQTLANGLIFKLCQKAIKFGHLNVISMLYDKFPDINWSFSIIKSIEYKKLDLIEFFLTKNKTITEQALIFAVRVENLDVLKLLLKNKNNIIFPSHFSRERHCLNSAIIYDKRNLIKYLIEEFQQDIDVVIQHSEVNQDTLEWAHHYQKSSLLKKQLEQSLEKKDSVKIQSKI